MADLTTVTGLQISFDAKSVTAVADHNPDTGEAITCVYGLETSFVRITETVDGFLARLGIMNKFAKLTRTDGNPIWINAIAVGSIRSADTGLGDPPNARSVVSVGSLTQRITDSLADARSAINAIRSQPGSGVQPL